MELSCTVKFMNTPRIQTALLVTAALPLHVVLIVAVCASALVLLVYAGIALPAVWSAKPARRKAAAGVLRQLITLIPAGSRETKHRP